ncbi:hypothetical protein BABINDRAFT_166972 [Babjeviella inositovora NRRL Y-12698]|uniref:2-dehydropantolactone reductase n=1 Tax=Babjeviella inositovora NRRL Y-12698 TaxID=984486 RepID=A0A1E3QQF0_9ASCO|nr:uncharacterized protein BABINDRAFT_166972 [Babjeviella inositovora NRRL Y-12698]ODQ79868.1 hypothetical protein BABINDRAFT_166972 [Babjeviella inositovora NRRL Y-12698]
MTKLATEVVFTLNNHTKIPALGLGTATPSEKNAETKEAVIAAVKAGYRHIDTAWYYGTEKYIGYALEELFAEEIVTREELFITTKVWPSMHSNPAKSLEQSLQDLGLDYVDLFLQHWPLAFQSDEDGKPSVPRSADGTILMDPQGDFIATYKKIEDLYKHTDLVKAIGVSNYSQSFLEKLLDQVDVVPAVNQIELHPQLPQKALCDYCTEHHIIVTAYSPLGSSGAPVTKLPLVQKLAKKYGVNENELLQSYHINSGRVVIPRSTNPDRIASIVRLAELSQEDLQALYHLGEENPKRYICDPWGKNLDFQWWD